MVADILLRASKDGVWLDAYGHRIDGGVRKNKHRRVLYEGKVRRVDELILEQANVPRPGPEYRPVQLDGDCSNCKLDNMRWMTDPERRVYMSTGSSVNVNSIHEMCRNDGTPKQVAGCAFKFASKDNEPDEEWHDVVLPGTNTTVSVSSIERISHHNGYIHVTMCYRVRNLHQLGALASHLPSYNEQAKVNPINDVRNDSHAVPPEQRTSSDDMCHVENQRPVLSTPHPPVPREKIAIEAICEANGRSRVFPSIVAAAKGLTTDSVRFNQSIICMRIRPESSAHGRPYKGYVFKRHDPVQ